jgi:two-component system response regulator
MTSDQVILLVEDDDNDAELTSRAFRKARIANPVVRVEDGVEALDYLFARGKHAARDIADLPAVVLLDLNLPRLGGIDVLRAIRENERTRHQPVVILTSSNDDRDRMSAYEQFANSYIQKPVDYDQMVDAAGQLGLYWMVLNRPPPKT